MGTLHEHISKKDLDKDCKRCGGEYNTNDRVRCMTCGNLNPKLRAKEVKSPFSKDYVCTISKEDLADQQDMRNQKAGLRC